MTPTPKELAALLREEATRYESVVKQNRAGEEHGGIVVTKVRERNERLVVAFRAAADALAAAPATPAPTPDGETARLIREHVNSLGSVADILESTARQCRKIAPTAQSRKPGVFALAVRAEAVAKHYRKVAPILQGALGAIEEVAAPPAPPAAPTWSERVERTAEAIWDSRKPSRPWAMVVDSIKESFRDDAATACRAAFPEYAPQEGR